MFARTPITFLHTQLLPKSSNEDVRRKEFILNIILAGFIWLLFVGMILDIIHFLTQKQAHFHNNSIDLLPLLVLLLFFCFLFVLSRLGRPYIAAYLLVSSIFLLATYLGYRWGIDLPAELLFYTLAIVTAGILVESRFAYLLTLLAAGSMAVFGSLSRAGTLEPNQYWRLEGWSISDMIMIIIIYLLIATVSWLSNREIEHSLVRAHASEAALIVERDMLAIRIKERTEELRIAEIDRMRQAYRFVEFGKISGGLFHDLISPLTALSLNVENIAASQGTNDPQRLLLLSEDVQRAQSATLHMQRLMDSMRRHITNEGVYEDFSIDGVIREVVTTLHSYAQDHQVRISIESMQKVHTVGDPVAFSQVLTNLLSNAVECFPKPDPQNTLIDTRHIGIRLMESEGMVSIAVEDSGTGIAEENQESIFEPFYSTKRSVRGLGIGLSLARRIIEKEFDGSLNFTSVLGKGSIFTIYFPIREP